jgi:ABC-type molybdate transport system permease subunit
MGFQASDVAVELMGKTATVTFKRQGETDGASIAVYFNFEQMPNEGAQFNRVIAEAKQVLKQAVDEIVLRRPTS